MRFSSRFSRLASFYLPSLIPSLSTLSSYPYLCPCCLAPLYLPIPNPVLTRAPPVSSPSMRPSIFSSLSMPLMRFPSRSPLFLPLPSFPFLPFLPFLLLPSFPSLFVPFFLPFVTLSISTSIFLAPGIVIKRKPKHRRCFWEKIVYFFFYDLFVSVFLYC